MEVMSERNDSNSLWGSRAPPYSALHRSESAPQSILLDTPAASRLNNNIQQQPQPSYSFLDSPNDEQRHVTFGVDTLFLEDDEEEEPDFLFPNNNATPRRTLAEIHSSSAFRRNRPPMQPARRHHPSRSVSSIELAAILNDRSKLGLVNAPPRDRLLPTAPGAPTPPTAAANTATGTNPAAAASASGTAGAATSAGAGTAGNSKPKPMTQADKNAAINNPFWPKSVFDMIQDDFPRTPSPMLHSLVPSKTVATARELRNVQLYPRIPSAHRRARAASCANLNQDYDLFGNTNDANNEQPNTQSQPPKQQNQPAAKAKLTKDFDAIFNSVPDDPPPRPSRLSGSRGHRRSVSINWTGDIPGLFEEQVQQPRSALKSSKSSILFPTLSSSPPDVGPTLNSSSQDGSITPPRASIAALAQQNSSTRPTSPLNPNSQPLQQDINESEPQIMPNNTHHHNNLENGAHASEQSSPTNFDFNYLDSQFNNPMLGTPHTHNNPATHQPYSNTFQAFPHAANFNTNPNYPHSFRDNIAAANDLKTMSMQMAMFFHQQQQLYAAQMAQMAAITGNQFNPSLFNPSNMANMFANNFPVQHQHQHHNSPPHHRHSWDHDSQQRGAPRAPRTYGEQVKKKDGLQGKSRGGRGRRSNRASHDSDRNSAQTHNGSGGVADNHARSPLLEEFRSSSLSIGRGLGPDFSLPNAFGSPNAHKQREWALAEIKGHIVEFATDQHGSRFIQQKLELAPEDEKIAVLEEAMAEAQRLMTDVFGNYVVQKLLDHGGSQAIKSISSELEGRMLSLSLHMYGCRVVQKALEVLECAQRSKLVRELDGHVLKCIRDQNGNHVIQKCVELVESNAAQFIVDAVLGQAVPLAGHSYGCRVVQRILEHGAPNQKGPVMMEIMAAIPQLIKDQYGNYVIQHVVEHGDDEERKVIMQLVKSEVCQLSQHKFASNVVERCLQFGSSEQREVLVEKLTVGDGNQPTSPLNSLVRDQFGNYVVQRVLDVAKPSQRERVAAILKSQVPAIKKYSYGKHIIARLEDGTAFSNHH